MKHFIRLDDIDARLNPIIASPFLDTSVKGERAEKRFSLVDQQLALGAIRQHASAQRYPASQVYLDLMPIFTSATCRIFNAAKAANVLFRGYDANAFLESFTSEIEVDLANPTFHQAKIGGLG